MSRGRIPLEELAKLPSVAVVVPSWSRDKIAFYWNKTDRFELYLMDLRSRNLQQMTDGQAPRALRAGFVWTRDDAAIIYGRDNDGDEQNNLYRIGVGTREVSQLNSDPKTQEYPGEVGPDNRSLLVSSNRNGQMNLFSFDLQSQEFRQLTTFKFPVFGGKWSSDGSQIAFTANECTTKLKNQDVYVMQADGAEVQQVFTVREGSQESFSDWHPDGRRIAITSDAGGASRPGILDLATREIEWLGLEGVEEFGGEFAVNGEWFSAIRNQDAALMPVLYRVDTGESKVLKLPPGMAFGTSFVLNDTKLLVQHAAANRRAELVLYDIASDTYEILMPAEYGSIDPSIFVADEYVKYPSYDGKLVPAILFKPSEIRPGEKLPAVINVHGGPTAQWFRGFDPYAQFLVDQGYVVLEPNVRGSTGYGVEWRDLNLMDWGGGDLEDVAAGAEYLKTLEYVDPERIAVMGGSYGGYMSFIAVGKKPEHFRVGVPIVGISDLQALYDESMEHFKYYLKVQMGDPEENRELWRDRSAVTHADQVRAKLLILHGTNDPRCPISQARLFRDRLVAAGKQEGREPEADFEYHEFTDEGHGPGGDTDQKLRSFRLLADFLERRLKG